MACECAFKISWCLCVVGLWEFRECLRDKEVIHRGMFVGVESLLIVVKRIRNPALIDTEHAQIGERRRHFGLVLESTGKSFNRSVSLVVGELGYAHGEPQLGGIRKVRQRFTKTNDSSLRCAAVRQEHGVTKAVRFLPRVELNG